MRGACSTRICLSLPVKKVGEKTAKPSDLNKIKVGTEISTRAGN